MGTPLDDPLYRRALAVVLSHEGGYVDDPDDPGGATNWGISLRAARALGDLDGDGRLDLDLDGDGTVTAADIRMLTPEAAAIWYREHYWDRYGYHRLPLWAAVKIMDLAVNMGARQAHILAQRACASCGVVPWPAEDGILGPITIRSIVEAGDVAWRAAIRAQAEGFYRLLAAQRPKSRKYLGGWIRRARA